MPCPLRRLPLLAALACLALLPLLAAPVGAGEEGKQGDDTRLVTRFLHVGALTMGTTSFVAPVLGTVGPDQVSDEEHPLFGAEGEEPLLPLGTADEIALLVTRQVEPLSWEITPGAEVVAQGEDLLVVTATLPVVEAVTRYLADLEAEALTPVTVEVTAVAVPPALLGGTPDQMLAAGSRGPTVVLTGLGGQRATAYAGSQVAFLQDFDVEVAQEATIPDPIVGVATTGLGVAVVATPGGDPGRLRVQVQGTLSALRGLRVKDAVERGGRVELPEGDLVRFRADLALAPGAWAVAQGTASEAADRPWVFLVRATPRRPTPVLAAQRTFASALRPDPGPLLTRRFDLGDLARAVEDELGAELNLVPSNFTPPEPPELPEPGPVLAPEVVMRLLPRIVAPGSWNRQGAALGLLFDRLAATNTAPVLDEVARIVGDLRSEFLRSVVVDAEVVEGPADLAGRLAGPEDEGFLLSEAERTALDAAIAAGEARVETRLRSVSLAGGRKAVSALRERAYLEDFEVEIAQKATIANPILQRLQEGTVLDVEPVVTCAGDAVHACVRFTRAAAEDPIRQVPTPFGDLDAPVLHLVRLRADVHLPLGRTGVVGAGADGDRGFLLLLTCRVAE